MDDILSWMARLVKPVVFPYPVMVGGGIVKTHEQVRKLAPTDVVAEWGSIETEASDGNGGRDYYAHYIEVAERRVLVWAANSRGIPNPGMKYVEQHARDLIKLYNDRDRPLVLNVSGKGVDDTLSLMKRAHTCGFRVITVNGACPNKADQPILCDDPDAVDELFERAEKEIGVTDTVFLWKVSCGMRRPMLAHNKARVIASRMFNGIITGNTIPNSLYYFDDVDDVRTAIKTEKNNIDRGGMSGPAILPIALDHTRFCAQDMPAGKVVFGCGGIMTPDDAIRYLRAGAHVVQITTAWWEANEDPDFIRDFIAELHLKLYPHEP